MQPPLHVRRRRSLPRLVRPPPPPPPPPPPTLRPLPPSLVLLMLVLVLVLPPPARAQEAPCADVPNAGKFPYNALCTGPPRPLSDNMCYASPNPNGSRGVLWTSRAGCLTRTRNSRDHSKPFQYSHWINCSKVLGPDWLTVSPAGRQLMGDLGTTTFKGTDFCNMFYNTHGYTDWLTNHPTLAQNEKCLNVVQKVYCTASVAPHDIRGLPNVYSMRTGLATHWGNWGAAACLSVCEDLWDACGLYDRDAAATYYDNGRLMGLKCGTPYHRAPESIHKMANDSVPTDFQKTACFHLNGTIKLPNCTSFMGHKCLNGGVWHPECIGCLCPPGFGGPDCGRCSADDTLWLHVNRSEADYHTKPEDGGYTGEQYAAAACAIMGGYDPHAGPIGNGTLADPNKYVCSAVDRLVPLRIPKSAQHHESTHNHGHAAGNATNKTVVINSTYAAKTVFDCEFNYKSGGGSVGSLFEVYAGALAKFDYGIIATDACFNKPTADVPHPWSDDECSVQGNVTFELIKQTPTGLATDNSQYYSPRNVVCQMTVSHRKRTRTTHACTHTARTFPACRWPCPLVASRRGKSMLICSPCIFPPILFSYFSGWRVSDIASVQDCSVGEREECLKNHLPSDYAAPCLKCKRFECECPAESIANAYALPCFLTTFVPALKPPGVTTPTYLGCSSTTSSDPKCLFSNSNLPAPFVTGKCKSSTCLPPPPESLGATQPLTFLLFYLAILSVAGLFGWSCWTARVDSGSKVSGTKRDSAGAPSNVHTAAAPGGSSRSEGNRIQHHTLVAKGIGYTPRGSGGVEIVSDVDLVVSTRSAGVAAIMGPSGAGKVRPRSPMRLLLGLTFFPQ